MFDLLWWTRSLEFSYVADADARKDAVINKDMAGTWDVKTGPTPYFAVAKEMFLTFSWKEWKSVSFYYIFQVSEA